MDMSATTPRQRWLNAMRGGPVDRVPLYLEGFHFPSVDDANDPTKREIVERIHDQVPGAPVLPKPISHARLAEVVAALL